MKALYTFLCLLAASFAAQAQTLDELSWGFTHPQDTARTKVWWFFGETPTTREGITADLEAFKWAGVGGVVYYDQVHGSGEGADLVFSPQWWQGVVFASQEAKRLGLSFEANIGNGYVAGGKWITPDKSMQRLAMTELLVDGEQVAAMGQVADSSSTSATRSLHAVSSTRLRDKARPTPRRCKCRPPIARYSKPTLHTSSDAVLPSCPASACLKHQPTM